MRGDVANTPLYRYFDDYLLTKGQTVYIATSRYVSRVCGCDGGSSQMRGGKNNRWVVGTNRRYPWQGQRKDAGVGGGGEEGEQGGNRQYWKRGQRGRGGSGGRGARRRRNAIRRKVLTVARVKPH